MDVRIGGEGRPVTVLIGTPVGHRFVIVAGGGGQTIDPASLVSRDGDMVRPEDCWTPGSRWADAETDLNCICEYFRKLMKSKET